MTDEQATGIVASAERVGTALVTALPAQFLMLVLLNVVFLGCVMWFVDDQMTARTAMANKLIDSCIAEQRLEQRHTP